jgi:rhamnose utilization protein RhaD (predicted bifunctional aldolase and dehydrogenase)
MGHASGGTLYPDHSVFLGHAVAVLRTGEQPGEAAERAASACAAKPALILIPGIGTLIRAGLGPNAEEMARCLALVASRIPPETPLAYLDLPQEAELLNWDAEKYRRTLNS